MSGNEPDIRPSQLVLSRTEAEALATSMLAHLHAKEALILVRSFCGADGSFANNDIQNMSGLSGTLVSLQVSLDGHEAQGVTENATTEDLAALVEDVEDLAKRHKEPDSKGLLLGPAESFIDPPIYFESALGATSPTIQGELMRSAAALADGAGLVGAGNFSSQATSDFVLSTTGFKGYSRSTYCEFSMTARTATGSASGWARGGSEDFLKVRVQDIAKRAITIAQRSEKPAAIEPGRYTVVLEPEAVDDFVAEIAGGMSASAADAGSSVFSKQGGGNRIGLKVADERVQLLYDPMDKLAPFSPMDYSGQILSRVQWIENGILKNLSYSPRYALEKKRSPLLNPFPVHARLAVSAQPQTLEDMIASTKRGIWVHRFGGIQVMDAHTLLLSGVTRDGLFLIENGKVTKALKNLRFSESPLFALNKLAAAGVPERSSRYIACPRLKVHDFEFTSLSDAI